MKTLGSIEMMALLMLALGETACAPEAGFEALAAGISDDCVGGSRPSHYEAFGDATAPELRVLAIGESGGRAHVTFDRRTSTILVLSAIEATAWTVDVEPGAGLLKVILDGPNAQRVELPRGIAVEDHSGPGSWSACAWTWPASEACDTAALVAGAERATGLGLSSYHGCRNATRFGIYDAD